MVNNEREIKRLLVKIGGPTFFCEWANRPLSCFDGATPKQMIESGESKKILDHVKELYNCEDRDNILRGSLQPP